MSILRKLPKSSKEYNSFRANLSLLEILKERGYKIPEKNENKSIKTLWEEFSEASDRSLNNRYESDTEKKSPLDVRFTESSKVNEIFEKMLNEQKKAKKNKVQEPIHVLFITTSDISLKNFPDYRSSVEILLEDQLLFNPLRHCMSPGRIDKLNASELNDLFSLESMKGITLPLITQHDPLMLYMNVKSGDVIRKVDSKCFTGQTISSVGYRSNGLKQKYLVVVTSSGNKLCRDLENIGYFVSILKSVKSAVVNIFDIAKAEEEEIDIPKILTLDTNLPSFILMTKETHDKLYMTGQDWKSISQNVKFLDRTEIGQDMKQIGKATPSIHSIISFIEENQ
jgi:DNA-directed RNA polymerase subunit H (RpoH/RPB5)